jgi:lipoprotein-anchoring transpeptidase ErfK/SrfK
VKRATVLLTLSAFAAVAVASTGYGADGRSTCGTKPVLGSRVYSYAAFVRRSTVAFRAPGQRPFARFRRVNVNGYPTLFQVRGVQYDRTCHAIWYRVQLPLRPNGITGYIPAATVNVQRIATRIVVDLSARRLMLFRRGRIVQRETAGIGSSQTPTPTGRFYINQRLVPAYESGPWGPAALGISAFSPVLKTWTQGGPIAIHGTSDPSSIGRAASHGCIRVRNAAMLRLFARTPAGTPVLIRA